jgi:hypothetical protein
MHSVGSRHFFFVLCAIFIGGLLSGCSPSDENDAAYVDEQWESDSQYDGDPYEQQKLSEGWRHGTLKVEVEISQGAEQDINDPGTRLRGPTTGSTNWQGSLTASNEIRVLVQPDLRVLVPTEGGDEERRAALETDPFYEIGDVYIDDGKVGETRYKAYWHHREPESNQLIESTRHIEEQGTVTRLVVDDIRPSLYGPGWEAQVAFNTETRRTRVETNLLVDAAAPVTNNEEFEDSESFSFLLYPTPNAQGLNDYPYLDPDMPASFHERITEGHLHTLSLLHQLRDAPALTSMLVGLETKASKDQLILSYHYSGNKRIPMWAGLEGMVAKPDNGTFKITITLTAN